MKARVISILLITLAVVCVTLLLTSKPRVTKAQDNQSLAPEPLAKKTGCLRCHSIDKKIVGPAYHDIAARYKDQAEARNALFETIKNGGKGNWTKDTGGVPMPPHSARLSDADIRRLVDWILSL